MNISAKLYQSDFTPRGANVEYCQNLAKMFFFSVT